MCKKVERKKDLVCDISERVFESGDKLKQSQKKKDLPIPTLLGIKRAKESKREYEYE